MLPFDNSLNRVHVQFGRDGTGILSLRLRVSHERIWDERSESGVLRQLPSGIHGECLSAADSPIGRRLRGVCYMLLIRH
jgi:hypothetical protein